MIEAAELLVMSWYALWETEQVPADAFQSPALTLKPQYEKSRN